MRAKDSRKLIRLATMLALCVLMATGGAIQAQGRGGGQRGGGQRMDPAQMRTQMEKRSETQYKKMCETLVLSQEQQKQADELFNKAQDDREKLFEKIGGDRSKMRSMFEKVRKTQQDFMKELEKLLTEEQKERLELIKKELAEQRKRRNR